MEANGNLSASPSTSGPSPALPNARMYDPFKRMTGAAIKKTFLHRIVQEKILPPKKRLYPIEDFESIVEE
jgi:hypothetical protein